MGAQACIQTPHVFLNCARNGLGPECLQGWEKWVEISADTK